MKLFVEVKGSVSSTNRDPTADELKVHNALKGKITAAEKQLKLAKEALEALKRECKHTVSIDVQGYPYDSRHCATCGISQGLV